MSRRLVFGAASPMPAGNEHSRARDSGRHADDGVLRLTRHQLTPGEHHVVEHL